MLKRVSESAKRGYAACGPLAFDLSRSPHVWVGTLLLLLFAALVQVFDYFELSLIVQTSTMAVSVVAVTIYSKFVLAAIRQNTMRRDTNMILGIFLVALGTALRSWGLLSWYITHHDKMIIFQSQWSNFFSGIVFVGYVLIVTAPKIDQGVLHLKDIKRLVSIVMLALGLALFLTWYIVFQF
jgi:hypothetical protein